MASQRHKMTVQNYSAQCTAIAEKQPAAGYILQGAGPYTVPVGPSGGPLKGSSLAGPAPAAIPAPGIFEHPLLALGVILGGSQIPPAQSTTAPSGSRTFPIGPVALLRVEPDSEGAWYICSSYALQEGDDVTVEATGNSATNGNFTAAQVSSDGRETRFFVPGIELAAPITAKGRVTITDGAIDAA